MTQCSWECKTARGEASKSYVEHAETASYMRQQASVQWRDAGRVCSMGLVVAKQEENAKLEGGRRTVGGFWSTTA